MEPSGHKRQLSNSTQASGNPAQHKAQDTGETHVPLPDEDEPLPEYEIDSDDMFAEQCILEPVDEHNDDSVYLLSEPPEPPSVLMYNAVQYNQFSWSAGALPSPPEGYAAAGTDTSPCYITAF